MYRPRNVRTICLTCEYHVEQRGGPAPDEGARPIDAGEIAAIGGTVIAGAGLIYTVLRNRRKDEKKRDRKEAILIRNCYFIGRGLGNYEAHSIALELAYQKGFIRFESGRWAAPEELHASLRELTEDSKDKLGAALRTINAPDSLVGQVQETFSRPEDFLNHENWNQVREAVMEYIGLNLSGECYGAHFLGFQLGHVLNACMRWCRPQRSWRSQQGRPTSFSRMVTLRLILQFRRS
jgi:hypothetical protein